jgi:preprotein translocase subunit YajC
MNVISFSALLAMAAPPTQPGQTPQSPGESIMRMVPFYVVILVVFYLFMIRPQQKKAKQHQELLKQVKAGDKVLTASGIIGTVITVKEKSISIRSADTKLEILKSAISEVTERSGESTESK